MFGFFCSYLILLLYPLWNTAIFSCLNCFSRDRTFFFTPRTQGSRCPMVQGDWKA